MAGRPAARVGDATSHGTPLLPGVGSLKVLIGNRPAWRTEIDIHICPVVSPKGPDGGGIVHVGSRKVLIENRMCVRQGDVIEETPGATLGHRNPIVSGCPAVLIGD
jgi:hypothetical protein